MGSWLAGRDQQQTHTQRQSLPSALHWHCAHISVQPIGGIGLIGLIPQPDAAQAGSGVAEVSRKAPTIRASSVAIRMAVSSWRWFRLVSDALSLEIPEPGFVAPE